MAWGMVFITHQQGGIRSISQKSWIFLILSGLATGASWLCYYKALQMGDASKVVPIDKLLNGGSLAAVERRLMKLEDVMTGFQYMQRIGKLFGEDCTFFTGMIEGINEKMNIDLLTCLKDPMTREVMYAEVLIQGILSGRTVDMDEIEANFQNKKMVETIRRYLAKANGNPGTTA